MRLFLYSVGLLLSLAIASATAIEDDQAAIGAGIVVQDRFLDDADRATLLKQVEHRSATEVSGRRVIGVPRWLSNSLHSVLGSGGEAALKTDGDQVFLPITEIVGDKPEHQDHIAQGARRGALADGHVGVVYLEGDGDFVLSDAATGNELRVPIKPGKLISWPNTGFTHRVERSSSNLLRRMLGPMTFDALSNAFVSVGGGTEIECTDVRGYMCVAPEGIPLPEPSSIADDGVDCVESCTYSINGTLPYASFNADTGMCYCVATACEAFVRDDVYEYWRYDPDGPVCPPLNVLSDACDAVNHAYASTRPARKVAPQKTFTYSATLVNSHRATHWAAKRPFTEATFDMTLPMGVTVKSYRASPKSVGAPVINTQTGVVTWNLGAVNAGRKVKLSLKLAANTCSTPAPLALDSTFSYVDGHGAPQTVDVCLGKGKALYVWKKGCDAIPKPAHNKTRPTLSVA